MAGKKGHSGPPGNANAFRHGLSAVQRRRAEGQLTDDEQDVRAAILAGLIADKGGDQQIGTAERILAEVISSDVALLVTVNQAIEGVLRNNQKSATESQSPGATGRLQARLGNSLTGNLQRFGFERVPKAESLQDIIEEMGEDTAANQSS